MALHLLSAIGSFRIAHLPHETLQLRIGIHSGSCLQSVFSCLPFLPCVYLPQVPSCLASSARRCRATVSSATPSTPPRAWSPGASVRYACDLLPTAASIVSIHFSQTRLLTPSPTRAPQRDNCTAAEGDWWLPPAVPWRARRQGSDTSSHGAHSQGKGTMTTYWLTGKDGFDRPLPAPELAASASQHDFK